MQDNHQFIQKYTEEALAVKQKFFKQEASTLIKIADIFYHSISEGHTIYLCGNGGSAADAQHVATELVGRFLRERRALPVVALTTNTSILTALGNDYSFDIIFSRQLEGLLRKGDLLVGISTSGRSKNILLAVETAKSRGNWTLGFTGTPGEPLTSLVDEPLRVPSSHTPYIQETQIMAWHIICDLIEQRMFDPPAE